MNKKVIIGFSIILTLIIGVVSIYIGNTYAVQDLLLIDVVDQARNIWYFDVDNESNGKYFEGVYMDRFSNLRYIGPNPNNWVEFNHELYRIIGIFNTDTHGFDDDGARRVKLIKAIPLGTYDFGMHHRDYNESYDRGDFDLNFQNVFSDCYYSYDWDGTNSTSPSSSYMILNHYYYDMMVSRGGSDCIYWSSAVDNTLDEDDPTRYYPTNDCTSFYLKYQCNPTYAGGCQRSYIEEEATWHLTGAVANTVTYADMPSDLDIRSIIYLNERGYTFYSKEPIIPMDYETSTVYNSTVKAPIGLMYFSDFLYANGNIDAICKKEYDDYGYEKYNCSTEYFDYQNYFDQIFGGDMNISLNSYPLPATSRFGNRDWGVYNWLYIGYETTITPDVQMYPIKIPSGSFDDEYKTTITDSSGNEHSGAYFPSTSNEEAALIRPVFYLKPEVKVSAGSGTYNNPYRIYMDNPEY